MANDIQTAVKELRQRGWTWTALGDALGTTRVTVDRWGRGTHDPTNPTLVLAALQQLLKKKRIPKHRRHTVTRA